jgi:hypothetical protein
MPSYQCYFLDESGNPLRYAELRSGNDEDAHREAMALLMRTGRFAGFELWYADLRIEVYKPLTAKEAQAAFP